MKTFITLAALAAFAGTSYAQMATLPPASDVDGVFIKPIGANAGNSHWDSTASIGSFKPASTTEGTASISTIAYNPLGLAFGTSMPSALQSNLNKLFAGGGTLRTIFLADSATWNDSLGYTYSGGFAGPDSFTAFANMEVNPAVPSAVNVQFGDYFDVNFATNADPAFDLWFQGENSINGGDYTLFHPSNSSPNLAPGNAKWAQKAIAANTWNTALDSYVDVSTYVIGLEDWRLDGGTDHDYSDSIIALQFYDLSGLPFASEPVPEPSTYGLIGAGALLGLVALRNRMRKGKVKAAI